MIPPRWSATLVKLKQNFQIRKLSNDSPVQKISEYANKTMVPSSGSEAKKIRRSRKKTLRSDFLPWLKKQQKLEETKHISSFVYTHEELAYVTMTDDYYITDICRKSFNRTNFRKPIQYWNMVSPLLNQLPQVDLHVLENNHLPPKFDRTNLHLRSITMLLMGALQKPSDPSVLQLDRGRVGDVFNLIVEGTRTRVNSDKLVFEILRNREWKENIKIKYSPDVVKTNYEKAFFHQYLDTNPEPILTVITPAVGDAILQAIAFWDVVTNLRNPSS